MTVQQVLTYPDERLRQKCEPVEDVLDEEVIQLIQDLKDTCMVYRAHGLAAPQIGVNKRVFVTHLGTIEPTVFINPEIIDPEDPDTPLKEGCLSFPGVEAVVKRFGDVTIRALNEEGEEVTYALDGIEAVAVQHEYDHLDGVLFIDRVSALQKRMMLKKLAKVNRVPKKAKPQPSKRAKARAERKRKTKHRRKHS